MLLGMMIASDLPKSVWLSRESESGIWGEMGRCFDRFSLKVPKGKEAH